MWQRAEKQENECSGSLNFLHFAEKVNPKCVFFRFLMFIVRKEGFGVQKAPTLKNLALYLNCIESCQEVFRSPHLAIVELCCSTLNYKNNVF